MSCIFPVVEPECGMSKLPGVKDGDVVAFDKALPDNPFKAARQLAVRMSYVTRGIKVFEMSPRFEDQCYLEFGGCGSQCRFLTQTPNT